jgi:CheY-like chemotaxis protein
VIDDQADHLAFVATLLRRAGYECRPFTAARDALDFLHTHEVALVVADLFMPEMDGFEVLSSLHQSLPDLPVITLSGGGLGRNRDFFLNCARLLGAVAVFSKPVEIQEFMDAVRHWVPLPDASDTSRRGAAKPSAGGDHV